MGFLNPENRFTGRPEEHTKYENIEGVREKIDFELEDFFKSISRGPLGIPSHALKAAAFQYANQCTPINQEFILCKNEEGDARKCLDYGHKVSDCAANFFKTITETCQETFVSFAQCLEHNPLRSYQFCRPEQLAFDKCAYEKLGFDKAKHCFDRYAKVKTDRPKPYNPHQFKNFEYPKPLPPDFSRPLPRGDLK